MIRIAPHAPDPRDEHDFAHAVATHSATDTSYFEAFAHTSLWKKLEQYGYDATTFAVEKPDANTLVVLCNKNGEEESTEIYRLDIDLNDNSQSINAVTMALNTKLSNILPPFDKRATTIRKAMQQSVQNLAAKLLPGIVRPVKTTMVKESPDGGIGLIAK